ncbi:AprI/Inh family metalloprotease inhibitor [Methylocapsa polymorpha]|uniref:AprI/Inh family metalloprotease inhibitor n=1 Tax=Methylocapsa polymorpha TaxID=3080828 RepID=A0ABZ0HWZ3_9HYPH|nr:AprI/Inh family metalloprotease inhibitor [Methylocapsa sp. RX1]
MKKTSEMRGPARRAASALASLVLSASLLLCTEARAGISLARPEAAVGQWDLSLQDSNRTCRVTLQPSEASGGRGVAMPAGCRRALPILVGVDAWRLAADDRLDLADRSGRPVLDFASAGDETLSPAGHKARPIASSRSRARAEGSPPAGEAAATASPEPIRIAAKASATHSTATAGEAAGRYSILRAGDKDTGCMLTLDSKTKARSGNKASLAPGCRDQGIVIFDPVAWQIVGGRLVLTARKGHSTHLDQQSDGTWTKDPKEGASLSLKKM